MKGHALKTETIERPVGAMNEHRTVYRWFCECGEPFGEQPQMSVHKVRTVHRDHKAAASVG